MKSPWASLSVFLPVFNEGEALPGVLTRSLEVLSGLGVSEYELIVVDDGSSDDTGNIADEWARRESHVRVVHHEHNMGYGAALTSGFTAARYEWVVYIDGDGQFDLADLKHFVEPSRQHDVVLGYRRARRDHLGRRMNAWAWGMLVNALLGLRVRDVDCGFKLFRLENLKRLGSLQSRGAVISPELIKKCQVAGYTWAQVQVEHYPREGGHPSGARLGVILRALRELWDLRQEYRSRQA